MKTTIKSTNLSKGKHSHTEEYLAWQPQSLTKQKGKIKKREAAAITEKRTCVNLVFLMVGTGSKCTHSHFLWSS